VRGDEAEKRRNHSLLGLWRKRRLTILSEERSRTLRYKKRTGLKIRSGKDWREAGYFLQGLGHVQGSEGALVSVP